MTDDDRDGDGTSISTDADTDAPADDADTDAPADDADLEDPLAAVGFDAERSVLTRRQAEVLALRERGLTQGTIAGRFGTSRANVASIEASARENVAKARETVAFVTALEAPVRVRLSEGADLYDVPGQVFDACDDAEIKVSYTAPELMAQISDAAGDAVEGRALREDLVVSVTTDGDVRVRNAPDG